MLRLVQIGLGPLGLRVVAEIVRRGRAELVAAVDVDPAWRGVRLSQRCPGAPELAVASGLDGVDWQGVDCAVLTTSSELVRCAPTLTALAERGVSVVSTCEELAYPWHAHAELADELDRCARAGGARLLGTGVNPGFVMDALPAFVSGVCACVRSLHVWRIQDASTRRVPFQQKIGAGLTLTEFRARAADKRLRHVGLGESLHFLARALALPVERWEEELTPVVAERALTCALGPIPAGHAAGVRQVARGYVGKKACITLEFQAAIGQPEPHDRVKIDGDPPLDVVVAGGIHGDVATTAIVCNCIESLLSAPPGLHTMATIPLASCRDFRPS